MVELTISDPSHDRVGARLLSRCRLADFSSEFGEVVVGRLENVAAFELGTDGDLEQF